MEAIKPIGTHQAMKNEAGDIVYEVCNRNPKWNEAMFFNMNFKRRLHSFEHHNENFQLSAHQLAKCGYFHLGFDNLVKCYMCGKLFENLSDCIDPWLEHKKVNSRCALLIKRMG